MKFDEYVTLLERHMQSQEEVRAEMRAAFDAFDRNGDGLISKEGKFTAN